MVAVAVVAVAAAARAHNGAMARAVRVDAAIPSVVHVAMAEEQAAPTVAMSARAMRSPWTMHPAISARAHLKIAAVRVMVMVVAMVAATVTSITAAQLPTWVAALAVASQRARHKGGSLTRCAPALT